MTEKQERHLMSQIMTRATLVVEGKTYKLSSAHYRRNKQFGEPWDGTWQLKIGLGLHQRPTDLPRGVQKDIQQEYDCMLDSYDSYSIVLNDVEPPIVAPNRKLIHCVVKWSRRQGYTIVLSQRRDNPERDAKRRQEARERAAERAKNAEFTESQPKLTEESCMNLLKDLGLEIQ